MLQLLAEGLDDPLVWVLPRSEGAVQALVGCVSAARRARVEGREQKTFSLSCALSLASSALISARVVSPPTIACGHPAVWVTSRRKADSWERDPCECLRTLKEGLVW